MNTFGELLKELRLRHDVTLREAARRTGISAPYLSDMERGRKSAPSRDVLKKLVSALHLEKDEAEQVYDLAGKAQNTIAYDLPEYIMDRDYVAAALRTAKELNAGKEQWEKFVEELYANEEKNSRTS